MEGVTMRYHLKMKCQRLRTLQENKRVEKGFDNFIRTILLSFFPKAIRRESRYPMNIPFVRRSRHIRVVEQSSKVKRKRKKNIIKIEST